MSLLIFLVHILAHICRSPATSLNSTFLFNGFRPSDLNLSDSATVTRTGALSLTNGHLATNPGIKGHAFYPAILQFKKPPGAKKTQSFSTRFVFEIVSQFPESGGHGLVFVLAPATNFSQATGGSYLGLFNRENNGNPANHVFAVEFDTVQQEKMNDKGGNHVGIDVIGANSSFLKPATYYTEFGKKEKMVLDCQTTIQAWIE
ncbi:L-type lectin-domain containing receptor kinase SIT2-like [Nymphaea colorata]|nr:L-type lectin-domain containing receptor kinase SIT2-like [Nymphaea colorata]